jgi:hypothetical protein
MKTITIKDFAKENNMLLITVYKQIENSGIEPIGYVEGKTKPHAIYNKDTLERLVVKLETGRPKTKPKQINFNVAKLW